MKSLNRVFVKLANATTKLDLQGNKGPSEDANMVFFDNTGFDPPCGGRDKMAW